MREHSGSLKSLLASGDGVVAPLVFSPLSAMLAARAGFSALYLGAGALGYVLTSLEANISVTQLASAGLDIRTATDLPLILDGACGWGDPMHLHHTIAVSEAAGFSAIELEDQVVPKRAHHHVGVEHLIPLELMVQKIEEAVAARRSDDFLIIARTNACKSTGFEDAVRRADAYRDAGADLLMVLPSSRAEMERIAPTIEGTHAHLTSSISPRNTADLFAMGYSLVIEGTMPLVAHYKSLREYYGTLAGGRVDDEVAECAAAELEDIHQLIGLDALLEVERRSVEKSQ